MDLDFIKSGLKVNKNKTFSLIYHCLQVRLKALLHISYGLDLYILAYAATRSYGIGI